MTTPNLPGSIKIRTWCQWNLLEKHMLQGMIQTFGHTSGRSKCCRKRWYEWKMNLGPWFLFSAVFSLLMHYWYAEQISVKIGWPVYMNLAFLWEYNFNQTLIQINGHIVSFPWTYKNILNYRPQVWSVKYNSGWA